MKYFIRSVAFFLCLAMLIPMVACASQGGNGSETVSESASETETVDSNARPRHKVPDELDYNEATFTTLTHMEGNEFYFADEEETSRMGSAVYRRNAAIEEYLNIKFEEIGYNIGYGNVSEGLNLIRQAVQVDDDVYQLHMPHSIYTVYDLVTGGYLFPMNELGYCDFSAEWWNLEMMEQLAPYDNMYYGMSDFMVPQPYFVIFNKELIESYNLENPYQLVYDGKWTVDKFIEMSVAVADDLNGDHMYGTDDIVGMTYGEGSKMISFLAGSEQYLTARDEEGKMTVGIYTEKTLDLIDKFRTMFASPGAALTHVTNIRSGKVLFDLGTTGLLQSCANAEGEFGVLPYPKYNEAQKDYISLEWSGAICVPDTIRDPDMVGAVLEMLAWQSGEEVNYEYRYVLLGQRLASDPDSANMLEIVFSTVTYDPLGTYFGFTEPFYHFYFVLSRYANDEPASSFVSYYNSHSKSAANKIKLFYTAIARKEAKR